MANYEDLKVAITSARTNWATLKAKIAELGIELTAAISRLLAKIAAGADTAVELNQINTLSQELLDTTKNVQGSIDEAKVEGL